MEKYPLRQDMTDSDIPLGLGMALAQNTDALKRFAALSIPKQQEVIENAHTVLSATEMRSYVDNIGKEGMRDER